MSDLSAVTNWRRQSEDEAYDMVSRLNTAHYTLPIDELKFHLIAKLTSILTLISASSLLIFDVFLPLFSIYKRRN